MVTRVSRRAFLKCALVTGAVVQLGARLRAGLLPGTASGITQVDCLNLSILTDNYYDSNRPDEKNAKRFRSLAGRSIHAEHGISFLVETIVDGKSSVCMFDYGLDPVGVLNNMALLEVDLGKVDAFSLSHGHYDHYTSAVTILQRNLSRIRRGTPFYVGEEAFLRRYSARPGSPDPVDLGQFRREDLEALGLKVIETRNPVQIIPGAYFTGNIGRITPYEVVAPTFLVRRGDTIEHDLFPGEQALLFLVKGKGLVILSGCAHCGIVNTVRQAQKVAGTQKVHAILGGFHLIGAQPEVLRKTVADIKALDPDLIVPAHCTGFEAVAAFSREMPDRFLINTAGTRYTFSA